MNNTLKLAAQRILLDLLERCTESQCLFFKRMYSSDDLERPLSEVVNIIPDGKLDWAISQCERTLNETKE